jgi:hypothetical protein
MLKPSWQQAIGRKGVMQRLKATVVISDAEPRLGFGYSNLVKNACKEA